jgi:hypothetical protein
VPARVSVGIKPFKHQLGAWIARGVQHALHAVKLTPITLSFVERDPGQTECLPRICSLQVARLTFLPEAERLLRLWSHELSAVPQLQCAELLVVRTGRLELSLSLPTDAEPKRLDLPWSAPASRRKREIVGPAAEGSERRPMRAEARARLLEAIAKARLWLDGLIAGTFASTA